jgi:hypothetical protein
MASPAYRPGLKRRRLPGHSLACPRAVELVLLIVLLLSRLGRRAHGVTLLLEREDRTRYLLKFEDSLGGGDCVDLLLHFVLPPSLSVRS